MLVCQMKSLFDHLIGQFKLNKHQFSLLKHIVMGCQPSRLKGMVRSRYEQDTVLSLRFHQYDGGPGRTFVIHTYQAG